jgi:hypothetical protein
LIAIPRPAWTGPALSIARTALWRPRRAQLIRRDLPIVILVERAERLGGIGDLVR